MHIRCRLLPWNDATRDFVLLKGREGGGERGMPPLTEALRARFYSALGSVVPVSRIGYLPIYQKLLQTRAVTMSVAHRCPRRVEPSFLAPWPLSPAPCQATPASALRFAPSPYLLPPAQAFPPLPWPTCFSRAIGVQQRAIRLERPLPSVCLTLRQL